MDPLVKEYIYKKINDAMDYLESGDTINTFNTLEEIRKEIQDGIYD
jgi:hypothetical protein